MPKYDFGTLYSSAVTGDGASGIKLDNDNAAAVLSSILTNQANLAQTNLTNTANLNLAREQNEWSEGMWNKQNAYNDPSAQMQRLLAAGLNPITFMGNSSNPSGTSSSSPSSADLANQQAASFTPPTLFSSSLHDNAIVNALNSVGNNSKGFADSIIDVGRLMNETSRTRSDVALNKVKEFQLFQEGRKAQEETYALIPTTIATNLADIRRKESEIRNLDTASEKYKSEIGLINEQKKNVTQQILQSQAQIDYWAKSIGLGYYQADNSRMSSMTGSITKVLENPLSSAKDAVNAVTSFANTLKGISDPKEAARLAFSALSNVSKYIREGGSEIASELWNSLSNVANDAKEKFDKTVRDSYKRRYLNRPVSNGAVVNPTNVDTYGN